MDGTRISTNTHNWIMNSLLWCICASMPQQAPRHVLRISCTEAQTFQEYHASALPHLVGKQPDVYRASALPPASSCSIGSLFQIHLSLQIQRQIQGVQDVTSQWQSEAVNLHASVNPSNLAARGNSHTCSRYRFNEMYIQIFVNLSQCAR